MMLFPTNEFVKLKESLVIYECALKNIEMRIDILLKDFLTFQAYNPIEHVKMRVKTPESIAEKLHRHNLSLTVENARTHIFDIAGIRCICYYAKDITYIADVLKRQPDIIVRGEKDYITNPKPSGYRSYHLILDVPVHLTNKTEILPVEIQIRTQAMDFWASLEHKVRYKYKNKMPDHLSKELILCADKIAELDRRMYLIQEIVDMAY
ncbi:MAG: GTP pyrophosphokinase family protein [Turicibacter sp.]|nr:GTP pyrophosphokinase family protein [Turicibacter sp.]